MGSDLQTFARWLVLTGFVLSALGGGLWLLGRWGVPRLPGDVLVRKEGFTFYAPFGLMILVSVVLTLVMNLLARRGR